MITAIIRWSVYHRTLVLLLTLIVVGLGIYSVNNTAVDALPDLSDVQVIVKTSYPGQSPQVIQDQITYPLSTAMLSVPGAETVRGFSFFGDSYVYVIFSEGTDLYWARSRVLEYLGQVSSKLPKNARPELGPDATGVGWVYIYSLIDKTGQHDLSELRSLQDWFLKYELQSVPGVAEVATLGGMVKQYQITVDPNKLRAFNLPLSIVQLAIKQSNQEIGASVIEMAEAEYMVTVSGYVKSIDDLANIPLGVSKQGTPVLLGNIAQIVLAPKLRRGIAELNGEGETVAGIIVMRTGENAQQVINGVKDKLTQLNEGLPAGVEIVEVHDRSALITRAIDNLSDKLIEEFIVVALVCIVFLFHLRSSLVAIISLPIAILIAFIVMKAQGLNANIMSLGGIAIAIGAMIDGAIVMIENMHKQMEKTPLTEENRWQVVVSSATEVGPALFFSLLIITVSFIPIFTLQAQEGRMFIPLAFTKTYAMAAAAILAITLVPVLMGYFVRGKVIAESRNPLSCLLTFIYMPALKLALSFPKSTLTLALILFFIGLWPIDKLGSEFMPELDEGDLMYMPTTYPGISIGKARELMQQTDKLIKTVPEVELIMGKVGRAETATDPAPISMLESYIKFKPESQWREGVTRESLREELNSLVQLPGVNNSWVMPIKTRIDMLATGIKTPVGIKISGPDLDVIQRLGKDIEQLLSGHQGTSSVYAERVVGGRYINIDINRLSAARYGLSFAEIQQVFAIAVGGVQVTETVEKLSRFPVNLRYPQSYRNSPEQLELLPIVTKTEQQIVLGDVATVRIVDGPASIKSENARLAGWVYIDIGKVDVGDYVRSAQQLFSEQLKIPSGYAISWTGQYEYMERVKETLTYVVPLTLSLIVILLYLNFRNLTEVLLILLTLPLAMVGSIWLMYLEGFNFSIAVGVGFIALAGVAVEIGVIMLVYLKQAYQKALQHSESENRAFQTTDIYQAVLAGAGQRIRPIMMTAGSVILGLLPIMYSSGTGSEIMSRIAAPMVGGMFSALILTLVVLPTAYYLVMRLRLTSYK